MHSRLRTGNLIDDGAYCSWQDSEPYTTNFLAVSSLSESEALWEFDSYLGLF